MIDNISKIQSGTKTAFLAALFLCALAPGRLAAETDPIKEIEKRVVEHTLKNGLKVLILERHQSPLVSYEMMFRTGGVDELAGKSGLAHLFEHMMFKGTKTVGTKDYLKEKPLIDEIDKAGRELAAELSKEDKAGPEKIKNLKRKMEELESKESEIMIPSEFENIYQKEGGEGLNAFTGKDMTGFVVSLPSNKWELWPIMESDRMANPVLREFYKEKDVVMEERRMRYENSPHGKLWENFLAIAFSASPYRMPVIGWTSDIGKLTLSDAESFYKTHYAPNNAVVAIVGDVNSKEVVEKLELYFAGVSSGVLTTPVITDEPPQGAQKHVTVFFDAEPSMIMGYHKPNAPHPDNFALEMIQQILSRGRTSRFNRNIVDKNIAVSAWSSNGDPGERCPNLITFGGEPRKPYTNSDLEISIRRELDKLKKEKVPERELRKILNQVEADFIRTLNSNGGMASEIAYTQTVLGDWRYPFTYLEELKKVTPDDIQRAAVKYFRTDNETAAFLEREK